MSKTSNEYTRYTFTKEEKAELSAEMAQKIGELNEAELQKKAAAAQFKSQIDSLHAEVASLAERVHQGFEMRTIKCKWEGDFDNGVWRVFRTDNLEQIKTVAMTAEDRQMKIGEDDNG